MLAAGVCVPAARLVGADEGRAAPRTPGGHREHLAEARIRFFFTDAHLAQAGSALGGYAEVPIGAERFDAERHDPSRYRGDGAWRTPYRAYLVGSAGSAARVSALVRDPRSSMQVWSRDLGYPGDEWYLEFHKIRWPGGLKLWRVSWPNSDLGAKRPYDPAAALAQVSLHGSHFASLLAGVQRAGEGAADGLIAAPFDTELFGHWWFEGVDFLAAVYRNLGDRPGVRAVTASEHLRQHPPRVAIELGEGSWGAGGDNGMWLNDRTQWTWQRLWALEDRFWEVAPRALGSPESRPVLAQAARELLLAQASDWQFIITTGAVTDYAERRFALHAADADRLVAALEAAAGGAPAEEAQHAAEELHARDHLFPDVFRQVEACIVQGSALARG